MENLIVKRLRESMEVKGEILQNKEMIALISEMVDQITTALRHGNKVIFAGNGGSFSDAIHLTAELVSRFMLNREPLPAVSLGTNHSTLTAIGNDYGFESIFSREIESIGKNGDVFIALTTSGNSKNIIDAVSAALQKGIIVYCMTGKGGGKVSSLCRSLIIPSDVTARIQEAHITVGHILCELVEDKLFGKK